MRRLSATVALVSALVLLAACTEKPQTNAHGVRLDAAPWTGTGTKPDTGTAFTASGWQIGDRSSWEQHQKTRAQNQNEYNRIN
ncbi:hypothetical protein [Variovorax ginsengisoli]|uniref:Lipoprotein n=1 Tax=Variovorax ginsengisoli TaxID=363844 RepID=A0ABT8S1Y8_9BURK|nr:hypothetical protein [Variovorax ginsengisoli]MDN8613049.1 hypothetical protein [Variovorax ginsengisoli]MDO1532219.1 hypothetical protein [Variovorax ginsengisoli]